MKLCENYAALLDPFLDGELPPEELARVQAHLRECPACRGYVDDALAIRAALAGGDDTAVPDGFSQRVMQRIREETPTAKPPRRRYGRTLAALAACCAVVVLLAPVLSQRSDPASNATGASYALESPGESAARADSAQAAPRAADKEESYEESATYSSDSAAELPLYSSAPVVDALTLPAEAVPFFAGYTPDWETEDEVCYTVTREEYETLAEDLREGGIDAPSPTGTQDTVSVILEKANNQN